MTNAIPLPLPTEPEARLDQLNAILVKVRRGDVLITPEDALELLNANLQESDASVAAVIWEIIERAPAIEQIVQCAIQTLRRTKGLGRDSSLLYLWKAQPERRAEWVQEFDNDSDPYVQHALARCEAECDPNKAVKRWLRLIESQTTTPDLEEIIPFQLAAIATDDDTVRIELLDRRMGGNPICKAALAERHSQST